MVGGTFAGNAAAWHGFKGNPAWDSPVLAASSDKANRADQGNTIKANEFLDTPAVLKEKVQMMADMIKRSKLCTAYTGAGLSKSAGIPDYATQAKNSITNTPKVVSNLDAQPTFAHCALTALERAGYLKHWVQQNHDGLPQKAGFPQEKINEIHGAWYDPSNPVVQFSGSLRTDLFNWMIDMENKIDLCLCLGTSLSGMNADRIASKPAKRASRGEDALGTIIVNLQQTRLDEVSSLRIWAKLDDVFRMLGEILNLGRIEARPFPVPSNHVFQVPYNEHGLLDQSCRMTLDLRQGQRIMIPIEGASNFGATGAVDVPRDQNSAYRVLLDEGTHRTHRLLGVWWVYAAVNGTVPYIPLINEKPVIVKVAAGDQAGSSSSSSSHQTEAAHQNRLLPLPVRELKIQQSHTLVSKPGSDSSNTHKWALSLAPEGCDVVESVKWILHPTFSPPTETVTEAPFKISRLGWGTFEVDAEITLKPEYGSGKYTASHMLSFDSTGDEVKTTNVNL